MKPYTIALVNKMIVIICCIHCNFMLPVRKTFLFFYRSPGVKRLTTSGVSDHYMKNKIAQTEKQNRTNYIF